VGTENYKLLIRNLRTKKNAKLEIRSTARDVRFPKSSQAIQILKNPESDNSKR
jgi:hypothetical protein